MCPTVRLDAKFGAAWGTALAGTIPEEEANADCGTALASAAACCAVLEEVNGARAAAAVALADDSSASRASRDASAESALPKPAEEEARCMPIAEDSEEEDRGPCTIPDGAFPLSPLESSDACMTNTACLVVAQIDSFVTGYISIQIGRNTFHAVKRQGTCWEGLCHLETTQPGMTLLTMANTTLCSRYTDCCMRGQIK